MYQCILTPIILLNQQELLWPKRVFIKQLREPTECSTKSYTAAGSFKIAFVTSHDDGQHVAGTYYLRVLPCTIRPMAAQGCPAVLRLSSHAEMLMVLRNKGFLSPRSGGAGCTKLLVTVESGCARVDGRARLVMAARDLGLN
jgi:hypothetical protein